MSKKSSTAASQGVLSIMKPKEPKINQRKLKKRKKDLRKNSNLRKVMEDQAKKELGANLFSKLDKI